MTPAKEQDERAALIERLSKCLPTADEAPDHRLWCSVLGSDLRAAVAALAQQPQVCARCGWPADNYVVTPQAADEDSLTVAERKVEAEMLLAEKVAQAQPVAWMDAFGEPFCSRDAIDGEAFPHPRAEA